MRSRNKKIKKYIKNNNNNKNHLQSDLYLISMVRNIAQKNV